MYSISPPDGIRKTVTFNSAIHKAMIKYGAVKVQLHTLLDKASNYDNLVLRPGRSNPTERALGNRCTGKWTKTDCALWMKKISQNR
jgi:hypothetical protein